MLHFCTELLIERVIFKHSLCGSLVKRNMLFPYLFFVSLMIQVLYGQVWAEKCVKNGKPTNFLHWTVCFTGHVKVNRHPVVLVKHACCHTGQYKDTMHDGMTTMSPLHHIKTYQLSAATCFSFQNSFVWCKFVHDCNYVIIANVHFHVPGCPCITHRGISTLRYIRRLMYCSTWKYDSFGDWTRC